MCPIKISNKKYLQVERLNNEPNFFHRDLVLDEEDQRKLQEDVILIFPQPITVEDIHKNDNGEDVDEGIMQNNKEKDVGWTMVSNRKGKAKSVVRDSRTFNEVARGIRIANEVSSPIPKIYFKDARPSGLDKGKNLM